MPETSTSPLTREHQVFHSHLDTCPQCANQPFNLCPMGTVLLILAVRSIKTKETR